MKNFVPKDFRVPEDVMFVHFKIKKLTAKDVYEDYLAWKSNIKLINRTRSDTWPTDDCTFEDNLLDLAWHQKEFDYRMSFAYKVVSLDENKYLGCVYIYPPDKTWIKAPANTDAVINMWVIQEAYDRGIYKELFFEVKKWIKDIWPFNNVFYNNKEIPQ